MRYMVDASPDCNVALGICKECEARFLSVSRDGAVHRLGEHQKIAHPSMKFFTR